jgi:Holliday junction resolvase
MTNYTKGLRAEYKSRDLLREQGYIVLRTAGSKGPFDLVALHENTGPLFIQVKTVKPSTREVRDLRDLCSRFRVSGILHVWLPRQELLSLPL